MDTERFREMRTRISAWPDTRNKGLPAATGANLYDVSSDFTAQANHELRCHLALKDHSKDAEQTLRGKKSHSSISCWSWLDIKTAIVVLVVLMVQRCDITKHHEQHPGARLE